MKEYHDPSKSATRRLQQQWATLPIKQRCRLVGSVRHQIAALADEFIRLCESRIRVDPVETVASELIPLCDSLAWLAKHGPKVLQDRQVGLAGRPMWLWGVRSTVRRVPLGRVLILGTWNYPLFLAGVQAAQALAAGNRVLLKPAPGCESATQQLAECFHAAGIPEDQLVVLGSDVASATEAIDEGVDLIVLTGSAATGRRVMAAAAEKLTACILELSGCDAMVVLPGADTQRVLDAAGFGLRFNQGATCIGPRRIFVPAKEMDMWKTRFAELFGSDSPMQLHPAAASSAQEMLQSAVNAGARDVCDRASKETGRTDSQTLPPTILADVPSDHPILQADLFAPIASLIPWDSIEDLPNAIHACPYRLNASIFGPADSAERLSWKLDVGSVVINDLVAPTADPRLPFGGCGESGYGVTRGPEGLLAMTRPQNTIRRRGRITPHLSPRNDSDVDVLTGLLKWQHQTRFRDRWKGLRRLMAAARRDSERIQD